MTSSNGNMFRVTGPLWGEFTGHRWIPLTKASDAERWCFRWINGGANHRDAGDFKRRRANYDVIVMPHRHSDRLSHCGRDTQMCVSKLTIMGSNNGLSPGRRQVIIWINAEILLIELLWTYSEILIEIYTFSFKENAFVNVVWKMSAILSRPQCVYSSRLHRLCLTDINIL